MAGRPAKFTRAHVQAEALRIVDEDGLQNLTMRAVAGALGTGPMTLYGHVRDRADLEITVVDAIFESVHLPAPDPDWRRRTEDICLAIWTALRRHPNSISLVLTRRGRSSSALAIGEALAASLAAGQLSGVDQVVVFRMLMAITTGVVEADDPTQSSAANPFAEALQSTLSAMPDPHPSLVALARTAGAIPEEIIVRRAVQRALSPEQLSTAPNRT